MPGRRRPYGGRISEAPSTVEKVSPEESDLYWATRPRGSQIAASVSRQSEPIESREALEQRFGELEASEPGEILRPPHWGGYRLVPDVYEFWEHRENRLHDRVRFRRDGARWQMERLQP